MSRDIRRMMNDNQLGIFEGRDEKQPSERLIITTGICGFYEPTERITTNQKTSIQNLYLPCKPILYNTIKNDKDCHARSRKDGQGDNKESG